MWYGRFSHCCRTLLQATLDDITTGLCRPLKNRVEQALLADTDIVVSYKIAGVLKFYSKLCMI